MLVRINEKYFMFFLIISKYKETLTKKYQITTPIRIKFLKCCPPRILANWNLSGIWSLVRQVVWRIGIFILCCSLRRAAV
jgi:hypothetical protein